MKTVNGVLFSFVLTMLTLSLAQAQPGGGRPMMDPEEAAARQTEQMKAGLGLSDEVAAQVQVINLKYAKKMQEARANAGEDRMQMREAMMAMNQEKDGELKQILGEAQFAKWQEMRQARWEQGGQGPRPEVRRGPEEKPARKKNKKSKAKASENR